MGTTPDTVILNRTSTDEISVSNVIIGNKRIKITLGSGPNYLNRTNVDEDLANKLCITEEQAVRLGKIGVLLEKKFGNPRNIEWAILKV